MVRFLKDADLARFQSASRRTFTHTRVLPNSAPATCLPLFPRSISRSTPSDRSSDKTWPTVRTPPRPRRFRLGTCETRCTSCSSASLGSSAGIADQTASSSTANPNIHHRARFVVSLIDRAVDFVPLPAPRARLAFKRTSTSPALAVASGAETCSIRDRRAPSVARHRDRAAVASSPLVARRPSPVRVASARVRRASSDLAPDRARALVPRPSFARRRRGSSRVVARRASIVSRASSSTRLLASPPSPVSSSRASSSSLDIAPRVRVCGRRARRRASSWVSDDRFLCRVGKQLQGFDRHPRTPSRSIAVEVVFGSRSFSVFPRFSRFSVFRASRRVDRASGVDAPTRRRAVGRGRDAWR